MNCIKNVQASYLIDNINFKDECVLCISKENRSKIIPGLITIEQEHQL